MKYFTLIVADFEENKDNNKQFFINMCSIMNFKKHNEIYEKIFLHELYHFKSEHIRLFIQKCFMFRMFGSTYVLFQRKHFQQNSIKAES